MHWVVVQADHLLGPERNHGEGFAAFIREFDFVDVGRPGPDDRPYVAAYQAVLREIFEQRDNRMQLKAWHDNHHTIGSLADGPPR